MSFLSRNKVWINTIFIISEIVNVAINFIINKLSQEPFNVKDKHNIITIGVFVMLFVIFLICHFIINFSPKKHQSRKLQKAFQEQGGYDIIAEEMKAAIRARDYKSIKELKKIANFIEE